MRFVPQPTEDLAGQRFGRLVVLARDHDRAGSGAYWHCRCDCGGEKSVRSYALRTGATQSCGCLKREGIIARSTKHGLLTRKGRSPTYNTWLNMIRRCTKTDDPRYPDWGGRGITVCERWLDYPAFLADMGERPPGMSIERINNDHGYEPGNCRWETYARQQRNTRSVTLTRPKILEIRRLYGQQTSIKDIAEATSVRRHTVGTVCAVLDALEGK